MVKMCDTIIIKRGLMKFAEFERINLINAEETHDGVVFTIKGGIQIYCTDNNMPNHTKNIIKNTTNSFPTANLVFDLLNYNKPVIVEPTKK
jgi:hypothetical protein